MFFDRKAEHKPCLKQPKIKKEKIDRQEGLNQAQDT
jgi:hypothetical protein